MGILVGLLGTGRISETVFGRSLMVLLLGNLLLSALVCGRYHQTLRQLGVSNQELVSYKHLLRLLQEAIRRHDGLLQVLGGCPETYEAMTMKVGSLQRILYLGSLFKLPLLWIPVQTITLWDFHVYASLEKWRRHHGASVTSWLEAIGKLEAIASLAGLAYDNPAWCYPEVDGRGPRSDAPARLVAEAMGHPLLPGAVRVSNDIALGPPGRVLFVTGSNMTGKSTLIRAIGANIALSQAGGPVCAKQFRAPLVVLATTVRVRDSLESGISLYMAELLRLKQVIDQVRMLKGDPERVVLFLLDEILLGTNTAERHVAARAVIAELARLAAFGAISTHDLALPGDPELAPICDNVHLSDRLVYENGSARLERDYLVRPGIAKSTNAIRLLEMVGICESSSGKLNTDTLKRDNGPGTK